MDEPERATCELSLWRVGVFTKMANDAGDLT